MNFLLVFIGSGIGGVMRYSTSVALGLAAVALGWVCFR